MDEGAIRALRGMPRQLGRAFRVKGCLGSCLHAPNGVSQGCPMSVIIIHVLLPWKRISDDLRRPVVIRTKGCPPALAREEAPVYWGGGPPVFWGSFRPTFQTPPIGGGSRDRSPRGAHREWGGVGGPGYPNIRTPNDRHDMLVIWR